ncbi:hypothetical protein [Vibrio gallaecicus]|nr:hypothetical protein [Vibrio gallaecicus]MDN3614280.1 hypothetical protein [Vibrio gallaecicus]
MLHFANQKNHGPSDLWPHSERPTLIMIYWRPLYLSAFLPSVFLAF